MQTDSQIHKCYRKYFLPDTDRNKFFSLMSIVSQWKRGFLMNSNTEVIYLCNMSVYKALLKVKGVGYLCYNLYSGEGVSEKN